MYSPGKYRAINVYPNINLSVKILWSLLVKTEITLVPGSLFTGRIGNFISLWDARLYSLGLPVPAGFCKIVPLQKYLYARKVTQTRHEKLFPKFVIFSHCSLISNENLRKSPDSRKWFENLILDFNFSRKVEVSLWSLLVTSTISKNLTLKWFRLDLDYHFI